MYGGMTLPVHVVDDSRTSGRHLSLNDIFTLRGFSSLADIKAH